MKEMSLFLPKMYQKNIYEIPYDILKAKGIKCLVFDLDNTLRLIDEKTPNPKIEAFIRKLEKEFKVVILSNSFKESVKAYTKALKVDGVGHARKPSTRGLKKIAKMYQLKPEEIAMIGDQLVTDILAGNRFGAYSVYVDALSQKDLKITYLNRFIERRILNYYTRTGKMMRGVYYGV